MRRFLAAIRFLTIVPVPGRLGADSGDLAGSVFWFPVVGLLLGGVTAGATFGATQLSVPPLLTAVGLTALLAAFSGCLHLDGLSDSADGMLSSRPRERMLEIMKDSRVGSMGLVVVVLVLLTKMAALDSLSGERLWSAALLMPLAGRAAMVLHLAILPCARPEGLGSLFVQKRNYLAALFALAAVVAAGWYFLGNLGFVAAGVWLAVVLLAAVYAFRKIGGFTGDTLGAACELAETAMAVGVAIASTGGRS